jgi:hypothetical protein
VDATTPTPHATCAAGHPAGATCGRRPPRRRRWFLRWPARRGLSGPCAPPPVTRQSVRCARAPPPVNPAVARRRPAVRRRLWSASCSCGCSLPVRSRRLRNAAPVVNEVVAVGSLHPRRRLLRRPSTAASSAPQQQNPYGAPAYAATVAGVCARRVFNRPAYPAGVLPTVAPPPVAAVIAPRLGARGARRAGRPQLRAVSADGAAASMVSPAASRDGWDPGLASRWRHRRASRRLPGHLPERSERRVLGDPQRAPSSAARVASGAAGTDVASIRASRATLRSTRSVDGSGVRRDDGSRNGTFSTRRASTPASAACDSDRLRIGSDVRRQAPVGAPPGAGLFVGAAPGGSPGGETLRRSGPPRKRRRCTPVGGRPSRMRRS